mmetsp:Transcript_7586/g.19403  ORF Transcript_7586/g.19403 Transcript_7586/m.19403 type:complete len:508 (-) Transcript_7586:170-1693(-)
MATLADSFLDDLDELEGDSDDDLEQAAAGGANDHQMDPSAKAGGDGMDTGDGDEDGDGDGEVDLDDMFASGGMASGGDISSVATLRSSEYFNTKMEKINQALTTPPKPIIGNVEDNAEYKLVVQCNDVVMKCDEEMVVVHKFVVDIYSKKFPELESLVPSRLDYLRVVEAIGNEMDMTMVDLTDLLPNAVVISVSMTGSTTSGQPLSEADLEQCIKACEEATKLEEARNSVLEFVETRMKAIAPNICAIIDTTLAAQLMGLAGGLAALSKIPACNVQTLGQQKNENRSGFGSAAAMPHAGLIYYATVVQNVPPYLRMKALKVTAAKVTLAARIDLHMSEPSGSAGARMRQEVDDKFEKWEEPQKARMKKALPVPDDKPRKKRGGKRARKLKEKFGMSEMRKDTNKRTFSNFEGEYGDDAMGLDMGMLGNGAGKLRASVKKEQKMAIKKAKKAAETAGQHVNGLSSSLVFTPVQGIELANPNAAADKVAAANSQWFGANSGFMSARPA